MDKWETVGAGGKKSSKAHGQNKGSGMSLQVDKIPVSQTIDTSASKDVASKENTGPPPVPPPSVHNAALAAKKKPQPKKAKPKKLVSFEECLSEVEPQGVEEVVEEVWSEDNPLNSLKELHSYLWKVFSKAEPEKDCTFSNMPPGYPLTALPAECQASLVKMVSQCPPLTQEKMFRYSVDLLLSQIGKGASSYDSRMMLLLLIQCNSSVCVEAGSMIKIYLESNMSKVPEALSLLWVGMPHPKLHLFTATRTWPELCLMLLQRTHVPRQVFSYAVDCTCLLIRCCAEEGNDGLLLEALTPTTLSSFLSSPHLLHKRSQKNVQVMLDSAQDTVLETAPDSKLNKYFRSVFKQITPDNALPVKFAARCLQRSSSCWEVWSGLGPSSPPSTVLLLKELRPAPPPLPVDKLASTLMKVSQKLPESEKELAKDLLMAYAAGEGKQKEEVVEEEAPGRGCCLLVGLLSLGYLCALAVLLYYVATQGPDVLLDKIGGFIGTRDVFVAWRTTAYALSKYCSGVLEYLPVLASFPEQIMAWVNSYTAGAYEPTS